MLSSVRCNLKILVGQWSKISGELVLNETHSRASHCLQDLKSILESQGAYNKLDELCSNSTSGLNGNSCPVTYVNKFEEVDSNKLLNACATSDLATECCKRTCQSAILNASMELASHGSLKPEWLAGAINYYWQLWKCRHGVAHQ